LLAPDKTVTTLADQLKAALKFDASIYPHHADMKEVSAGRLIGAQDERNRTKAIDQALCEVVDVLEHIGDSPNCKCNVRDCYDCYLTGEYQRIKDESLGRLRAALEPASGEGRG
jgi:hypothetical protein